MKKAKLLQCFSTTTKMILCFLCISVVFACNKKQSRLEMIKGDLNQEMDVLFDFFQEYHKYDAYTAAKKWCDVNSDFEACRSFASHTANVNPRDLDKYMNHDWDYKIASIIMESNENMSKYSAHIDVDNEAEIEKLKQYFNNRFGEPSYSNCEGKKYHFEWETPKGVRITVFYELSINEGDIFRANVDFFMENNKDKNIRE